MIYLQVMQDALDEATDSWGVKVGSDNEIKMVSFLKCHEASGLGNMARWWHAHKMRRNVIMAKVIMTMAAKMKMLTCDALNISSVWDDKAIEMVWKEDWNLNVNIERQIPVAVIKDPLSFVLGILPFGFPHNEKSAQLAAEDKMSHGKVGDFCGKNTKYLGRSNNDVKDFTILAWQVLHVSLCNTISLFSRAYTWFYFYEGVYPVPTSWHI